MTDDPRCAEAFTIRVLPSPRPSYSKRERESQRTSERTHRPFKVEHHDETAEANVLADHHAQFDDLCLMPSSAAVVPGTTASIRTPAPVPSFSRARTSSETGANRTPKYPLRGNSASWPAGAA